MKRVGAVITAVAAATFGLVGAAHANFIVVAPGGGPHVRTFSPTGSALGGGFFAYDPQFGGGVSVAIGDVMGTAAPEIVTGSGPGMEPLVRVWSTDGQLLSQFDAYVQGFGGGVSVAVANLDGLTGGEIVTGPGFGGGPDVRVFDGVGTLKREWMAYDPNFGGGIHVAAGQVSGFSNSVVTAPLFGGGPHVRVFDGNGVVQREWMAYDPGFGGGVNVAVGNGRVITAPFSNGGPHVRVFDSSGNVTAQWMAYDPGFSGGVAVAAGTLSLQPAIVTGAGPGGGPHVKVFDQNGGAQGGGFFAYDPSYAGGVNVAVGNNSIVTGAGVPRIVEEVLAPGATGSGVAGLQQRLLAMGYWLPAVDGKFGSTTTQAVYAFQKANGLPRDGKIGPEDQAALNAGNRPTAASTSGDLIEVDKARQLFFVIRGGAVQWAINTSTGSNGTYSYGGNTYRAVTPEGHFTFDRQIDGYHESHLGTMYRPKYFTAAGHAIHGSPSIPPYPASHGCVRLSNAVTDFIWAAGIAPLGSAIWVHS
jgi:lipoprotein-anchoring transpeptidase ErfK/SrfK